MQNTKAIILTRCITLLRNNMPAMLFTTQHSNWLSHKQHRARGVKIEMRKCVQKWIDSNTHTRAIRSSQFTINVIKCISARLPLSCTVQCIPYPKSIALHRCSSSSHSHTLSVFFLLLFKCLMFTINALLVISFICLSVSLVVYQPLLTSFNFSAFPLNRLFHCFFPIFCSVLFWLNTVQSGARAQLEQIMHPITIIYVIFNHLNEKSHYFNSKLREQKREKLIHINHTYAHEVGKESAAATVATATAIVIITYKRNRH